MNALYALGYGAVAPRGGKARYKQRPAAAVKSNNRSSYDYDYHRSQQVERVNNTSLVLH